MTSQSEPMTPHDGKIAQMDAIQCLRAVLALPDPVEALLSLSLDPIHATSVVEMLHSEASSTLSDSNYRKQCLSGLRALVKKHSILPPSLFLANVTRDGDNPLRGGGFADIWRGTLGEQPVCLKVLRIHVEAYRRERKKVIAAFYKEALVWTQLSHPNVLPLLGVNMKEFSPAFCLVSPWMTNGDIVTYLEQNPDHDRLKSTYEIASGLAYLHSLEPRVIHGDIKGGNVLVDDLRSCRLADFGLSAVVESQRIGSTTSGRPKGTVRWMAPEMFVPETNHVIDSSPSDVYAYACTVFEIMTGKPPFAELMEVAAMFKVVSRERPPKPINGWCPDDVWNLVEQCWSQEPKERPCAVKIERCLRQLMFTEGSNNPQSHPDSETPSIHDSAATSDRSIDVPFAVTSSGPSARRGNSETWEERKEVELASDKSARLQAFISSLKSVVPVMPQKQEHQTESTATLTPVSDGWDGEGTIDIPQGEFDGQTFTQKPVFSPYWDINMNSFQGAQVRSWWMMVVRDSLIGKSGTLVTGPSDPSLCYLRDEFVGKLQYSGMTSSRVMPRLCFTKLLPSVRETDSTRDAILDIIRTTIREQLQLAGVRPDFILVLLSHQDTFICSAIKRIGDIEFGLLTKRIQLKKAMGNSYLQYQYLTSAVLKINAKLGGVNHRLDQRAMYWLSKKRTMIVGISVAPCAPAVKEGTPWVAAVVANVDEQFIHYPTSISVQRTHEISQELKGMIIERLGAYKARNGCLPERVLVFRDGVSQALYDTVLDSELPHIIGAFETFDTPEGPYRPVLSLVVCGKPERHSQDPENSSVNTNTEAEHANAKESVTRLFDLNFNLRANAALKSQPKTTNYVVIYNESMDDGEGPRRIDGNRCCIRADHVGMMPPTYYAKEACQTGIVYLYALCGRKLKETSTTEPHNIFEMAKTAWGSGVHPNIAETMFYI